jgi:hypothetical protein
LIPAFILFTGFVATLYKGKQKQEQEEKEMVKFEREGVK